MLVSYYWYSLDVQINLYFLKYTLSPIRIVLKASHIHKLTGPTVKEGYSFKFLGI